MTAIGYVRVSTDEQATSGLSVEAQEAKLRHWAAMSDMEIEIVTDAGWSSKNLNRPGIELVLERVRSKEIGCVVVAKLDRLTRSQRDLWTMIDLFDKYRVSLVSIGETLDTRTAAGRMLVSFLGAIAQWEREAIAERTKDALAAKRIRGERLGNIPYGFRSTNDGILEPCEEEQRLISHMRADRERGASLREIADGLNESGWRTRSGALWRYQYIANILKEKK